MRPCVSQHFTSSPPMAMTRLIRSCSSLEGSSPTKVNTSLMPRTMGLLEVGVAVPSSQPPGSWKTTTCPRCGWAPNHGENLFTSTRSPGMIVFCIDCDGMKNAWTMNVLMPRASSNAMPSRIGISRQSRIGLSRRRRPFATPVLQSPRTALRAGVQPRRLPIPPEERRAPSDRGYRGCRVKSRAADSGRREPATSRRSAERPGGRATSRSRPSP